MLGKRREIQVAEEGGLRRAGMMAGEGKDCIEGTKLGVPGSPELDLPPVFEGICLRFGDENTQSMVGLKFDVPEEEGGGSLAARCCEFADA